MNAGTANLRAPSIEEIKARYSVTDAWRDEGCQGEPGRSCCSPFREDRHKSFSVYDDGRKWKDHASGDSGDVLDFIVKARGCAPADALAAARERLGWAPSAHGPALSRRCVPVKPAPVATTEPRYRAEPMTGEVRIAWEAGLHWLAKVDDGLQREIDRWRAWPDGTARFLADEGLLSAPQVKGQRGLAWLISIRDARRGLKSGFTCATSHGGRGTAQFGLTPLPGWECQVCRWYWATSTVRGL